MRKEGVFNLETYKAWRAGLPWTDEQFAQALEQQAEAVKDNAFMHARYMRWAEGARAGMVGKHTVSIALGILIKVCSVKNCGKKALYRIGIEGRCSTHRMVSTAAAQDYKRRVEARSKVYERERKFKDNRDLQDRSLSKTSKHSKKGMSR